MKRRMLHIGCTAILFTLLACNSNTYTLTVMFSAPGGKTVEEVHKISASTDSVGYARAATLYYLSVYAYRKMSDNAKPFISKPTGFKLVDETGRNVDSLLGRQNAEMIRNKLDTLIN